MESTMTAAGRRTRAAAMIRSTSCSARIRMAAGRGAGEEPEPLGPQADLAARLLARRVQDRAPVGSEAGGCLEQERGLADPGLAADEDERSRDQAAPQDPVQLAEAHGQAGDHLVGKGRERHRLDRGAGAARPCGGGHVADDGLHERVPGIAGAALSLPAEEGLAAGLADIPALRPRHGG
jgi:hypothetical protein